MSEHPYSAWDNVRVANAYTVLQLDYKQAEFEYGWTLHWEEGLLVVFRLDANGKRVTCAGVEAREVGG